MLRTLASVALIGAVFAAPALGQTRKTEFGVDVSLKWQKPSGGGSSLFAMQTPVDFRVAFPVGGNLALEPRVTAAFVSGGGSSYHAVNAVLNLLIGLPGGAYNKGTYVTVGASALIVGGTGSSSETTPSVNAGLGMRSPMGGAGASRAELFVAYTPKRDLHPSILAIGGRLGLSFFN